MNTIIATAKVRTVTARLVRNDFQGLIIEVAGANKWLLCELPDNGHRLEMQKEWRHEVERALIAAGADRDDVWTADWQVA